MELVRAPVIGLEGHTNKSDKKGAFRANGADKGFSDDYFRTYKGH